MHEVMAEFGSTLRFGSITQVSRKPLRYKVSIDDADGMETPWLLALCMQSFGQKSSWPMKEGTQVALLLMANGESGVILGAVPSEEDLEPDGDGLVHDFGDGSQISYDPESQVMTLKTPVKVVLDTPLVIAQNIEAQDIQAQNVEAQNIDAVIDITIAGQSANSHQHRENGKGEMTDPMKPV